MSELQVGSASVRVFDDLVNTFEAYCFETSKLLAPHVESEIELMLLATFKVAGAISDLKVGIGAEFSADDQIMLITPQFEWQNYRIDFCIRPRRDLAEMIFVECDGHDFHERTKEQAERDRSKDRAIQAANIPILRFTGREIWRSPAAVVMEIFHFLADRKNDRSRA